MKRVVVVGTTGSGKTVLGAKLAESIDAALIELDALRWGPGWKRVPLEQFRREVSVALTGDTWVACGNYPHIRDLTWRRADTLVWLDYPLSLVVLRLVKRTLGELLTGTELWAGNRTTLRRMVSRESLFLFAIRSHHRWRLEYPGLLAEPSAAHLATLRFCRPVEAHRWVASLLHH